VTVSGDTEALRRELGEMGVAAREIGQGIGFDVDGDERLRAVLEKVLASNARLNGVLPKRETLEDVFVRRAL
jgi:ABC-2 type transport system ATP-binding protein